MTNQPIDISVVVPAKDEEKRLPDFLTTLINFCQRDSRSYEIIVVDDGSRDQTFSTAQEFQKIFPNLHTIRLEVNRGKGHAVKSGVFKASGEVVLFLDADGATGPEEITKNLHYFEEGYDIVIGSRVVNEELVKAKFYRKIIGKVFNYFVQTFLFKKIKDTQCGFKMFRKEIVRPLFSRIYLKGFGFDIELLYLAHKMGYSIKESAVNWTHVKGSKVNLITDSLRMFVNILQVRNWHCTPINLQNQFMSVQEIQYMYEMEKYHWWFHSKGTLVKHLTENLDHGTSRILDAGCGTGQNLSFLKGFGTCFGCDVVEQALIFSSKNGSKNLARCNLESLCYKDQTFDLITSLDVIEHIENPDKVLREFNRILDDKGTVILTVPAFKFLWSQHDDALCHLRRYEKKDLGELVTDAGFKIEKMGYFFFTSFFAVAPIRLIRRLFVKKGESKSDTTTLPPKFLNKFLKWIFKMEVKVASVLPLPVGTTLYAVISKA